MVGKGKELRCWQRVNKKAGLCALAQLVGVLRKTFPNDVDAMNASVL